MKKTILFIAANPKGYKDLKLHKEQNSIEDSLARSKYRDQFEIMTRIAASKEDLIRMLGDCKPYIVHISGHGSDNTLFFEHEDGHKEVIYIDGLITLLEEFTANLKCLIMNACYSFKEIEGLNGEIDYVVGMIQAITNKSAMSFSKTFYDMVFSGIPIKSAFQIAKKSLGLTSKKENDIPKLIDNSQVEDEPNDIDKDKNLVLNHFLHQFPRGPMVEGHMIKQEIIEAYAKLIDSGSELLFVNKANQSRMEADSDDKVRVIQKMNLPAPQHARPLVFWNAVFGQARLNGPRMLAALLHVLPDEQIDEKTKRYRSDLLDKLKNHS